MEIEKDLLDQLVMAREFIGQPCYIHLAAYYLGNPALGGNHINYNINGRNVWLVERPSKFGGSYLSLIRIGIFIRHVP